MAEASQGGLSHWESEPEPFAALLILLDQFPRSIFTSSENFQNDACAKRLCLRAIKSGVCFTTIVLFSHGRWWIR